MNSLSPVRSWEHGVYSGPGYLRIYIMQGPVLLEGGSVLQGTTLRARVSQGEDSLGLVSSLYLYYPRTPCVREARPECVTGPQVLRLQEPQDLPTLQHSWFWG